MVIFYKLEGREMVPCTNVVEWSKWFSASAERIINKTEIDDIVVITTFVGFDQAYPGNVPEFFATTAFAGVTVPVELVKTLISLNCSVYEKINAVDEEASSTYEEAEMRHKEMVEKYSKSESGVL